MTKYMFHIEGTDRDGYPVETEQDFNHHSEEQARRGVIQYCNEIMNMCPRKIRLVSASERSTHFDFS